MKRPNITPGPWKKTRLQGGTSKAPLAWGSRYEVTSPDLFIGFTLSKEDARAIAAVPELLAALETLAHGLNHDENSNDYQIIKAALTKAGYEFP